MRLFPNLPRPLPRKTLALAALALTLSVSPAFSALPDAVRFSIVMEMGDVDKAEQWLKEGLPPNFEGDRIGTGLMIGAWEGRVDLMQVFVQHGADVNYTNAVGEQALQLAAWRGNKEAVLWLIDHGAQVKRGDKQWSALHYAAFAGHQELVQLLIDKGGDVNARAPNESSVLMMAVREGHTPVVKQLLAAGADTRAKNDWGDNALTWAMRYNRLNIASMVAPPEEFAEAVKAPPESFGPPTASIAAPIEVSEILRQIRIARSEGRPVADLQDALFKLAATLKASPDPARAKAHVEGLVITAKRKRPGEEKAELIMDGQNRPAGPATPAQMAAAQNPPSEVGNILVKMRQAQARGEPVEDLRKQLIAAVNRMQTPAASTAAPVAARPAPVAAPAAKPAPQASNTQSDQGFSIHRGPAAFEPASRPIAATAPAAAPGDSVATLVGKLRQAKAEGRPTAELERALIAAVQAARN